MDVILIPYRNREIHLEYFLKNSAPLLKELMPNLKILIIEQDQKLLFNRGKLLNIGYSYYKKVGGNFFTHDVDLNPTKETIEQFYKKEVEDDMMLGIYTSFYDTLGGIIKFKNKSFEKINGFPNRIWGWGTEDKALQNRAELKKLKIVKNLFNNDPKKHEYFKIFDDIDDRDQRNEVPNWHLYYRIYKDLDDEKKNEELTTSGLNTLEYNLLDVKKLNEYVEKITVEI